ncbi:hypothetical protein VTK73DRAFT_2296 [Phialemonium thermophilum]|uniref:Ycf15 n=1 Tax=Phialemonium thermophilum TaxID=223376 RepID=A0ABR3VSC8_9PEZI
MQVQIGRQCRMRMYCHLISSACNMRPRFSFVAQGVCTRLLHCIADGSKSAPLRSESLHHNSTLRIPRYPQQKFPINKLLV